MMYEQPQIIYMKGLKTMYFITRNDSLVFKKVSCLFRSVVLSQSQRLLSSITAAFYLVHSVS